jgi:hypothetical protein
MFVDLCVTKPFNLINNMWREIVDKCDIDDI